MSENEVSSAWSEKREKMGKSIDDVSVALRIAPRYLRGIEKGNFDGWPEKVFSTGFIRTYAKYLSVDPSPVLDAYERTLKKTPQEEEEIIRPEWMERGNRKNSYVFVTGAVLIVGVALAFFTMRGTESPKVPPQPPQAAQTDNAAQVISEDNAAVSDPKAPASAVDNAAAAKDAAQAGRVVEPAPKTVPPAPATPPPPAATSTAGSRTPLTGPFDLTIEASEHTWLTYILDGGELIEATLQTDDKISIRAEKHITLRLGNAGGVTGTLNGQRLPPFGESGRVRTMHFGR